MIAAVLAHHARRAQGPSTSPAEDEHRLRYRQQSLDVLFRKEAQ